MFSWICPQCGRDVTPSHKECPYCAERAQEAAAAPAVDIAVVPAAPVFAAPAAPVPHAAWQQPPQHSPQHSGPPTWLMGVGFAVVFIAIGAGVYFGIQRLGATAAQKAGVENPANPSRQKVTNPLQKYIEVVGVRTLSERKEPVVRFVVVNHSSIEMADLAGNVTLWASTSHSEEEPVGTFHFSVPSLGPYETKDLKSPLKTKLKMYEMPDWQNATAEIQITSPPAP